MSTVQGHCDDKFEKVRSLLQNFVESEKELGASIVVNLEGEDLVDIWCGYADADKKRQWERDSITNIFSTTKTVAAFAILVLADQGILSDTDKVSKHWPEFAANGKQDIEIRHIMSHTSGVAGFDSPVTVEDICDSSKVTKMLAEQAPWWKPGTASGYHSFTQGYLLAEIVKRTTGKSLKQFIAEDIAAPLDADFQLGCLEKDEPRRSNVIPPPPDSQSPPIDTASVGFRVMSNPPMRAEFANSEAFRKAEIGAGNGHSNARGVNRILSVLSLNGKTAGGKQTLSPETVNLIFNEQYKGPDYVLPTADKPIRWGVGFGLTGKDTWIDWLPEGRVCTWGGYGGSMAVCDLDRRLTITYVMNKMSNVGLGSDCARAYIGAVYEVLGVQ